MNSTGVFTEDMKDFFGASDGAYTAFTSVEIKKGTFNVKSVIRGLLIDKLGRENIPVVNVSAKQTIEFQVCDKAKIYGKSKSQKVGDEHGITRYTSRRMGAGTKEENNR